MVRRPSNDPRSWQIFLLIASLCVGAVIAGAYASILFSPVTPWR